MKTIFAVFSLVFLAVGCESPNRGERAMVRQVKTIVNRNERRIEEVAGTFEHISTLHGRMSNLFVHSLTNGSGMQTEFDLCVQRLALVTERQHSLLSSVRTDLDGEWTSPEYAIWHDPNLERIFRQKAERLVVIGAACQHLERAITDIRTALREYQQSVAI